jgi:predicted enzyme related to lactoylglutathione lyase
MPEAIQPDPFEQLLRPVTPHRPRLAFTMGLRRQLEEEAPVSVDLTAVPATALIPTMVHLAVPDADRAMRFFAAVLGWESERVPTDHVSHFVTNTANVTPRILDQQGIAEIRLGFGVDDPAATARLAVQLGGRVITDEPGYVEVEDGQGTTLLFWVQGPPHPHDPPTADAIGDLGYLAIQVADEERASAFYSGVLGWPLGLEEGEDARYRHVQDHVQPVAMGVLGGAAEPRVSLYFVVPSLEAATARVVEAGGAIGEAFPSGPLRAVDCTSDDGLRFTLAVMDR